MRDALNRNFGVVVVIWTLALAVGFSLVSLSHAQLSADQWSSPPAGPAWLVTAPPTAPPAP